MHLTPSIYKKALLVSSLLVIMFQLASVPALTQGEGLTPEQRRGRKIYLEGVGAAGRPISAMLEDSRVEIPAASTACANCHGRDGFGKPEGGITPSDITWNALTRPYGVTHRSGRKHPPYDDRLLARAITAGLDPAGNTLHALMPRYRLSPQDASDLIAYIKVIGKHPDPGLSDSSIRIGTTVITDGSFAEMSRSVQAVLAAYFSEVNKQGGVFNRRIELQPVESGQSREERVEALRASIENEEVFALVGVFMAGAEEEIDSLVEANGVPLIGAFTLSPPLALPPNPYGFYLSSGLKQHGQALAIFAREKYQDGPRKAAIISSEEKPTLEAAEAMRSLLERAGWKTVEHIRAPDAQFSPERIVATLKSKDIKTVFLLAPADAQDSILRHARANDFRASYFIPGVLAGRKALEASYDTPDEVFLSAASLPSDQTPGALSEYEELVRAYKLPAHHLASQTMALASARVLVEGLKRAGRDVSRQKVVELLEEFFQFKTGLTPPITFGPNRRVGSAGAYIVTVDRREKRLVPASRWIEPE